MFMMKDKESLTKQQATAGVMYNISSMVVNRWHIKRKNTPMVIRLLNLVVLGAVAFGSVSAAELTPTSLRCEYRVDPLGIDVKKPRLSWIVTATRNDQRQTAYRILVASAPEKLAADTGDLWDSGKMSSDNTIFIEYAGVALKSGQRCHWKVQVWDGEGRASEWSKSACWSMGLLEASDWKGQWIGWDSAPGMASVATVKKPGETGKESRKRGKKKPAPKVYLPSPHLRKEFNVSGKVAHASLYATAQGFVEMRLNGARVGDEYFTPGWTDYRKRIYYRTYDVTPILGQGPNVLGAILGDGWFRGNISILGQNQYGHRLRVLTQLVIDYADGRRETIVSDPSWKASFGPILESDMQAGETYDARLEISGWDSAGFDDHKWAPVNTGSTIKPLVQAYPGAPVRRIRELKTVNVTKPQPNLYVFDMGQNFSGWIRLRVKGEAGTKLVMRFGEMLNADGTVYTENLRSARATDTYICKGDDVETWEPHFTFHGFRYVQIAGFPGKPAPDNVTGIVASSDSPVTGAFECSNPMLNTLYSNILWGQLSNYLEVPTDCPQRDERLGWTGDTQVFIRTGSYNQDVGAFFTKWVVDLMDTQKQDGSLGNQAPVFHGHGSPAWEDAGVVCPWTILKVYADTRLVEKHYDSMIRFMKRVEKRNTGDGFGDWLAIGSETSKALIGYAYNAQSAHMLADIAEAIGRTDDAKKYHDMFMRFRNAFRERFVKPDGKVEGDSQTAYCLALHFDLLTDAERIKAAEHLVSRIKEKNYHLSVGFVGVPILLPTLAEVGRTDLAYRLIQNTTYPSWGYSIEQGATTIWERWNSYTKKVGFGPTSMNSFNHYAYGSCGEWMFRTMLGIDTEGIGFKKIRIAPEPGGGITYVKGHYDSIRGRIKSEWKLDGSTLSMTVTIPPNTTATVYVPGGDKSSGSRGSVFVKTEDGKAIFEIPSGSYTFLAKRM
jgi:alpha-L-rhamnosidase